MKVFNEDPANVIPNFTESDFIIVRAARKYNSFIGLGYVSQRRLSRPIGYTISGATIDHDQEAHSWQSFLHLTKLLSCEHLWHVNQNNFFITFIVLESLDDLKQVLADVKNTILVKEITQQYISSKKTKPTDCQRCHMEMTPIYVVGDTMDHPSEYTCNHCGNTVRINNL